jgi:hypothetical protein
MPMHLLNITLFGHGPTVNGTIDNTIKLPIHTHTRTERERERERERVIVCATFIFIVKQSFKKMYERGSQARCQIIA